MEYGNIICSGVVYNSYEINKRINEIKCKVSLYDLQIDEVVAIALPRSFDLVCSMLALLEIEVPFLLVDMTLPKQRIEYMLANVNCKYIISLDKLEDNNLLNYIEINDTKPISYFKKHGGNLAYLIFTSGSTGNPKAVMIRRNSLFNFIECIPNILSLKNETISAFTNQSFDIFILETIMALINGFNIVLANDEEVTNPQKLINLIKSGKITTMQLTPSRFLQLSILDKNLDFLDGIKNVLIGGEQLSNELLKKIQVKGCNIYNMYGPTETTIWSSVSNLTHKKEVDIGRPIWETDMYIMNDDMIMPKGQIGEICISGIGLAEGYYGRSDLTEKAFVYINSLNKIVYKTGDIGYINDDDNFMCLGRKDNQVKLRGHRIELEEIDINIQKFQGIELCATCLVNSGNNNKLVCFYEGKTEINTNEIKEFLSVIIPKYMIPTDYIRIGKLIYTVSGKIDRKALVSTIYNKKNICPANVLDDIMSKIISICKNVLEIDNITKDSVLSDLEINSINFVEIVVQIEDLFEVEFDDERLIYTYFSTINDLYKYVKELVL